MKTETTSQKVHVTLLYSVLQAPNTSLSNRSSTHLQEYLGVKSHFLYLWHQNIHEFKYPKFFHLEYVQDQGQSLCVTDENGYTPISLAVSSCKDSCMSIKPKLKTTVWDLSFLPKSELRSAWDLSFPPKSKLRSLMEYAAVKYHNSWDALFGSNKCWLNLQNAHGYSALHYACLYDLPKAVDNLIQAGIDITLVDNEGNQPLHIASSHSSANIVRTLLNHKRTNCFKRNLNNMTALEIAIQMDRLDAIHALIGHMCLYRKPHPLCESLRRHHKGLLQKLLKTMPFDTNICKGHNMPIFIVALISEPHCENTENARCNRNHYEYLLGDLYLRRPSEKLLEDIFQYIDGISEEAISLWIKDLMEFKNYQNKYGNTLLHYSCWYNATRMTRLLLEVEADLFQNQDGNTPLHLCCISGNVELAKLLLDKGLSANTQNDEYLYPLSCACTAGNHQILKLLLEHGFHPNLVSEDCNQALDSMPTLEKLVLPINKAVENLPEGVPLLLQYGAYINFSYSGDNTDTVPHMKLINIITNIYRHVPTAFTLLGISFESYYRKSEFEKALCHFITAGALISKESNNTEDIISFERVICNINDEQLIRLLVESGYRFSINLEVPEYLQQLQSNPYTLQCIAGHIVRTNLRPNAWVGVKQLPLPTKIKEYIILYSTLVSL